MSSSRVIVMANVPMIGEYHASCSIQWSTALSAAPLMRLRMSLIAAPTLEIAAKVIPVLEIDAVTGSDADCFNDSQPRSTGFSAMPG
jgi:hypothetical protein